MPKATVQRKLHYKSAAASKVGCDSRRSCPPTCAGGPAQWVTEPKRRQWRMQRGGGR